MSYFFIFFFFQAEDGIRDLYVTGVQTCALPICDEASENIRILTEGLLALESFAPEAAGWREQIDTIFRAMHTIKGSARLLGFEQVGRLAHTCEHILGAVRDGRRVLDRALADDLLRGADALLE